MKQRDRTTRYTFLYKNLFIQGREAEHALNLTLTKNIAEVDETRKAFTWILYKIMELICFSANNIRLCNIVVNVVHVQLCF